MPSTQPDGYLARPSGDGHPVLVLHAWWGLNDTIKAVCDRLAQSGFLAFAPDLYGGEVTADVDHAEVLAQPIFADLQRPRAALDRAVAYLREQDGTGDRPMSAIGFSLGAFFALDLSVTHPDAIRNVVVFYGTRPGDYSASRAAYLGHFAATDEFEPRSEVESLEEALRRARRPVTFYHYANTGHWFAEPDREQVFDEGAAALAWDRTLSFLKRAVA